MKLSKPRYRQLMVRRTAIFSFMIVMILSLRASSAEDSLSVYSYELLYRSRIELERSSSPFRWNDPEAEAHLSDRFAAMLLLEPFAFDALRSQGEEGASWYSANCALFSERPHLVLQENFWDADAEAATTRHIVVDAATGDVTTYAASYQAYTEPRYRTVLEECGFHDVRFYPSLTGGEDQSARHYLALVARK